MISYNLVAMSMVKSRVQEKDDNIQFFEIADKLAKLDNRKNKTVAVRNWWED